MASTTANRIGVKVTFNDGDYLTTEFNGSLEDAQRYYVGQWFDHYPDGPDGREVMRQAVQVEVITTASTRKVKTAIIRREGYPIGQPAPCFLRCCGNELDLPELHKIAVLTCPTCGTKYDEGGWVIRPQPVVRTHKSLGVCRLSPEQHKQTCGYWYTVHESSMAHCAFASREHLDQWMKVLGLTLESPLSDTEWGWTRIVGEYRTACYMDEEPFHALEGDHIRHMSNGSYTLGIVTTGADGVRTIHYLNPNVKNRPVFDYTESRQLVG